MRTIEELANLVTLRNHLLFMADGPRTGALDKNEEKPLREMIGKIDREIIENSLDGSFLNKKRRGRKPAAKKASAPKTIASSEKTTALTVKRVEEPDG